MASARRFRRVPSAPRASDGEARSHRRPHRAEVQIPREPPHARDSRFSTKFRISSRWRDSLPFVGFAHDRGWKFEIGTEVTTNLKTAVERARRSFSQLICAGEMNWAPAVVRVDGLRPSGHPARGAPASCPTPGSARCGQGRPDCAAGHGVRRRRAARRRAGRPGKVSGFQSLRISWSSQVSTMPSSHAARSCRLPPRRSRTWRGTRRA